MTACETSIEERLLLLFCSKAFEVAFDAEFTSGVLAAHIADFSEDRTFRSPGAIIAAEAPEDAAVGIGIAAIDGVFVVEVNHRF